MSKTYQVVGIGNAIVDVLSQTHDVALADMGVQKGIMQLVDRARGEALYDMMDDRAQVPGGSVANTLAGLGNLGLSTAFIGRVADDALGRFYASSLQKSGTGFPNLPVKDAELPTSRSMIFISPDGERSMNTYLGISGELDIGDVPPEVAGSAEILFLEGYLYDKPKGKAAFEEAARLCRAGGGKAGIALSDPFCVDRHRDDFKRMVRELDFVIGNEHEWQSLYQAPDLGEALDIAGQEGRLIVCTRGAEDVVVMVDDDLMSVPVARARVVDATGAGDQFAAGFLFGLATGRDMETSVKMGCVAAGEVISHIGARPNSSLADLFTEQGLM